MTTATYADMWLLSSADSPVGVQNMTGSAMALLSPGGIANVTNTFGLTNTNGATLSVSLYVNTRPVGLPWWAINSAPSTTPPTCPSFVSPASFQYKLTCNALSYQNKWFGPLLEPVATPTYLPAAQQFQPLMMRWNVTGGVIQDFKYTFTVSAPAGSKYRYGLRPAVGVVCW